jgi:opacity protein-like surface antigen
MRTVRIGVLLGASMFAIGGASQAADIVEPEAIAWSGLYMGLHGGWGWADAESEYGNDYYNEKCGYSHQDAKDARLVFIGQLGCAVDLKPEGGFVGVQAGYNHMFDNGLMLGIEGDYSLASLSDDGDAGTGIFNTHVDLDIDQLASVRARLGFATGQWLPFVTAGWGWAHADRETFNSFIGTSSDSNWHDGWTIGAGAEYAINHRWSVKGEYRYYDLSKETYGVNAIGGEGTDVDINLHTVQFGVNIHW